MERFPCPICASSMRPPNSNCVTSTWNWRHATTDRARWPKRPPLASRSMGVRKTHPVCAAFSTNAKSPQESSRYEHRTCPSRCPESSRIHRNGGTVSLHRSDAFRLLRVASIPRLYRRPLGLPNQHLLEQASHQETRPDRMLSKERNGLSPVLAPSLPPNRPREHSQPSGTRNRIHSTAHRNARLCSLPSAMEVPRNRTGKSRLFLQSTESPQSLPSLEDLSRPENFPPDRPLLRRQIPNVFRY